VGQAVAHQRALLDELHLDVVTQAAARTVYVRFGSAAWPGVDIAYIGRAQWWTAASRAA
jgi:hypothetical protein